MFTVLSVIGILIVTQLVKSKIMPKYGATGVHVFIFAIAIIVCAVQLLMTRNASFAAVVIEAGKFLVATVGVYEVIFSKLGNSIGVPSALSL